MSIQEPKPLNADLFRILIGCTSLALGAYPIGSFIYFLVSYASHADSVAFATAIPSLFFPVVRLIGASLFLFKKRSGWIILFWLLCFMLFNSLGRTAMYMLIPEWEIKTSFHWLMIIDILIIVLLCLRVTRINFTISKRTIIWSIAIAALFAATATTLTFSLMNKVHPL